MYAVDVKWLVCNKDTNFLVKVTARDLIYVVVQELTLRLTVLLEIKAYTP